MWKIIRLFLPLLIIGFIAPMIIPGKDGQPIMSMNDWLPDKNTVNNIVSTIKKAVNKTADITADITGEEFTFEAAKKQLYKWKEKQTKKE